jgi:hypothetical protein
MMAGMPDASRLVSSHDVLFVTLDALRLDALDHAAAAAGLFQSAVAGVDVAFERGSFRPFVLEVNAFGDFFPGWVDGAGQTFHAAEIAATAARAFA